MHQKILQQTRGNAGGKETPTKKHCIVMDKMQGFILSPAICGKMLTRHKIQKRNSPSTSNTSTCSNRLLWDN